MTHAKPNKPADRQLRYHAWWLKSLAVTDGLYGATYVLGGQANSPSLLLVQKALPIQLFGAVLVIVSGLLLTRKVAAGGIAGAAVWMVFTLASLATVLQGTALSTGGPILLLGWAVLHILITYGTVSGLSTLTSRR